MKLASKSACALMLAAAFFAGKANQASALPVHFFAAATQDLVLPVACKYGSGKCANVKPVHQAPSEKHGPQDPTVDPDCNAYHSCSAGGPGWVDPAGAAKAGTTAKPNPVAIGGIKAEAVARQSGGAPNISRNFGGHLNGH
jgi:hypothetical protein